MEAPSLPLVAGMVSTAVFAGSMLPMLVKAARTRDLSSYSIGNLVLANIGNVVHSFYVFHLPAGPIWMLHGFYLLTSALMLCWWICYRPSAPVQDRAQASPEDRGSALGSQPASAHRREAAAHGHQARTVPEDPADPPRFGRNSRSFAASSPARRRRASQRSAVMSSSMSAGSTVGP